MWTWGATRAQVRDGLRARARQQQAEDDARLVAIWRGRHPLASCSDAVALKLAELEDAWSGGR